MQNSAHQPVFVPPPPRRRLKPPVVAAIVLVLIAVGAVVGAGVEAMVLRARYSSGYRPGGFGQGSFAPGGGFGQAAGGDAVAKRLGSMLAGRAPQTVSSADARRLSDAVPDGATVNKARNEVDFTGGSVKLVIVASPSWGKDMTFRIAGLDDPTISVPASASISVQFINGDSDMAHMWALTSTGPPYGQAPVRGAASVTGGHAAPLGDAQSQYPSETITFSAPASGTYWYLCAMPGHAAKGMYGRFVVTQ